MPFPNRGAAPSRVSPRAHAGTHVLKNAQKPPPLDPPDQLGSRTDGGSQVLSCPEELLLLSGVARIQPPNPSPPGLRSHTWRPPETPGDPRRPPAGGHNSTRSPFPHRYTRSYRLSSAHRCTEGVRWVFSHSGVWSLVVCCAFCTWPKQSKFPTTTQFQ